MKSYGKDCGKIGIVGHKELSGGPGLRPKLPLQAQFNLSQGTKISHAMGHG